MLRIEVKKKGLILFMKKIYVKVMYTLSEVMVPDYIANDIKKYVKMFDKWLLDKDNNHGYWIKEMVGTLEYVLMLMHLFSI